MSRRPGLGQASCEQVPAQMALCEQYGSERLAAKIVIAGRSAGVSGLPENDDWTAWNADEMRAAVDHLHRSAAPDRALGSVTRGLEAARDSRLP